MALRAFECSLIQTHQMSSLAALLASNPNLELSSYGKVHCKITRHDIPARVEAVEAHLKSGKYRKAAEWCGCMPPL